MSSLATLPAAPAPAPAPAPTAEIPAPALSTETLASGIRAALSNSSTTESTAAAAPKPVPPPTATPGIEPSPAAEEGALTQPIEDEAGTMPAESTQWPKSAIDTITAVRAKARAKRQEVESALQAEKARAESLQKQLDEARQAPKEEAPAAPAAPATDALGAIPEVRQARLEQQTYAETYRTASQMLARVDGDFEGVVEVFRKQNVDLSRHEPEQVKAWLQGVQADAQLRHSDAAARARAVEQQAAQALGAQQQDWTSTAQALAPDLAKEGTPTQQEHLDALKRFPFLASDPMRDYAALAFVEGHKLLQARAKRLQAPAAPAPATTPPPASPPLPGAPASLPAPAAPANGVEALRDKYFKTGREEDRQAWVKATMGLSS